MSERTNDPIRSEVTVGIAAPPASVWALVSDITKMGRWSPETFEAEWLDGATGPAVGARFRGHNRRNGKLVYWTKCEVVGCDPGREFTFVVGTVDKYNVKWSYRFAPGATGGTDVTESFELADKAPLRLYWKLLGSRRGPRLVDAMRSTLDRIKVAAEAPEATA